MDAVAVEWLLLRSSCIIRRFEGSKPARTFIVEESLALDAADGLEMLDAARDRGAILLVGHRLAIHPGDLKIQEMVTVGTLGT
jgi:hypothetical protein